MDSVLVARPSCHCPWWEYAWTFLPSRSVFVVEMVKLSRTWGGRLLRSTCCAQPLRGGRSAGWQPLCDPVEQVRQRLADVLTELGQPVGDLGRRRRFDLSPDQAVLDQCAQCLS